MKIFVVGRYLSGKTTISKRLAEEKGMLYFAIDDYRHKYSDGSQPGENFAYKMFVRDCTHKQAYKDRVIECTGLSVHFEELFVDYMDDGKYFTVLLSCFDKEVMNRRKYIREKSSYVEPPSPYDFSNFKETKYIPDHNLELHTDLHTIDESIQIINNVLSYTNDQVYESGKFQYENWNGNAYEIPKPYGTSGDMKGKDWIKLYEWLENCKGMK